METHEHAPTLYLGKQLAHFGDSLTQSSTTLQGTPKHSTSKPAESILAEAGNAKRLQLRQILALSCNSGTLWGVVLPWRPLYICSTTKNVPPPPPKKKNILTKKKQHIRAQQLSISPLVQGNTHRTRKAGLYADTL